MRVLCSSLRVERTCSYCSSTTFSYEKFDGLSVSRWCKTQYPCDGAAPGAAPDSGTLELVAIKGVGLGGIIRYEHLLKSGGHVETDFTDVSAVAEVELVVDSLAGSTRFDDLRQQPRSTP